jgi:FAD/FMN-containing dehydrogenase
MQHQIVIYFRRHTLFAGRRGWACDNVREFEVVRANGSIETANEPLTSNLFSALRGGVNSFTIVTRVCFPRAQCGAIC